MKVLLLTPYSPLLQYDHAANDVALPLVEALAPLMELHVFAPGQQNGAHSSWVHDGVTYHAGSPVHRTQFDRLGTYPYAARGSWSRRSTREAVSVIRSIRPDVVHAEYFQTAEPLLRFSNLAQTSIMLHDPPEEIAARPRGEMSPARYLLQQLERAKTRRAKNDMLNKIGAILVYSERDKQRLAGARGLVEVAPGGSSPRPAVGWLGDRPHVAAFGGAMWRSENETTAVFLARQVLPRVRQIVHDAELRIFGSRPTAAVRALDDEPGVTIVGEVADFDDEFRRAGVTLTPAMAEAGRLTKAIRAMAMGCPVVLNSASAHAMSGLTNGVHALVGDSPDQLARHVAELMQDSERASQIGEAGMALVLDYFSWERTVQIYRGVFAKLLAAESADRRH